MMDTMKHFIELAGELALPMLTLIGAVMAWKQTGKIDLVKTLEAAADGIEAVRRHAEDKHEKKEPVEAKMAISDVLATVEKIRGHKVSKKLEHKVAERVKARLGHLLKQD